ncbi:MAG: DUF512 domain-containing protein [Clostridiales bacterium]|nr:DUF512 domain-containing protein [Clostridiales bacterium]
MKNGARIMDVETNSIAWEAGLAEGDIVVSINGKPLKDIFDYYYSMSNHRIRLKVKKSNGGLERLRIYKEEYEDIGLLFSEDLIDGQKSCTNKCIFCFIDQLPPGMRETLYFKDDDARLSMLYGNYVTLTNTGMDELKRLARLHLSPINISVHTVNPELRVRMMNNKFAGDIIEKITFLANKKIKMNCQIVLVRGYNDKEELARTITELSAFYPNINSLSVVPVGLTKYRQHLSELIPFDKTASEEVIDMVEAMQKNYKERTGCNFVYAADEFYIMAKRKTPLPRDYDGYPQIENGVGLITSFEDEVESALSSEVIDLKDERIVTVVTGVAAFEFMKKIAAMTEEKINNLKINVHKVKNNFFGETVTVAGLITGNDIINSLQGIEMVDEVLFPGVMLKADEDIFLDNTTPKEISELLGVKFTAVYVSGYDFIDKVTGREMDV